MNPLCYKQVGWDYLKRDKGFGPGGQSEGVLVASEKVGVVNTMWCLGGNDGMNQNFNIHLRKSNGVLFFSLYLR